MAVSEYDKKHLNTAQQQEIQRVTDEATAGKISWDEAHKAAENIRSTAGYSGGSYGNGYTATKTGPSSGSAGSGSSGGGNGSSSATKGYGVDDRGQTDYSTLIRDAMSAGAGASVVQDLLDKRVSKAQANGYNQYLYDDVYAAAAKYIQEQNALNAPAYESAYGDDIQALLKKISGMSYEDWTKGDDYAALAKRYAQQGQAGMQNVLGQVASRTGGLASSYAATAAQQQYNDYMSQLEAVAREMYAGERSDRMDDLNLYRNLENDSYNKYLGDLSQWNSDRSFRYNAWRDSVSDSRYDKEWNYNVGRDEIGDQRYNQEWNYNVGRDEISDSRYEQEYTDSMATTNKAEAQERISTYLASGGKAAKLDSNLVALSGYTQEELAALESYYARQTATSGGKSYGGGSSGKGGTTGLNMDYDGLFAAAMESGRAKSYIANNYKTYGFSSTTGLYDEYEDWAETEKERKAANTNASDEDSPTERMEWMKQVREYTDLNKRADNGMAGTLGRDGTDSVYTTKLGKTAQDLEDWANSTPMLTREKVADTIEQAVVNGKISEAEGVVLLWKLVP